MRLPWAVLLMGLATPARAQQPVWVFLRPEYVNGDVVMGLRAREPFPNDRAIPRALLKNIEATGAHVRYASRWLQAVSVDADAGAVARLRKLRPVDRLARVRSFRPLRALTLTRAHRFATWRARAFAAFDSAFYGPNWWAIKMLGVPGAHAHGYTGSGVRIAILDTGFEPTHEALSTRTLAGQRDFIYNDNNVADEPGDSASAQEQHGTWVWSVLGGYKPGMIVGPAFDATFSLAKVDYNDATDDRAIDEDRWVAAVEWADSQGVRIISSSLAYRDFVDKPNYPVSALNGDVTLAARMADEAARRGILIVNAMGNTGPDPQSLWTPADADSVIAAGAVDPNGNVAVFSSRGPSGDGRIKPDLAAPGVNIFAASSAGPTSYNPGLAGTSFATPLLAGVAALFMQAWPNLSIMDVRNALVLSASRASAPDNNVGYGVPNIASAILFPQGIATAAVSDASAGGQVQNATPTFTWQAPLVNSAWGAVRYRLELARDSSFATLLYSDTVTNAFSLTVKIALPAATVFYWRVVAAAAPNVVRVSNTSGPFTVAAAATPAAVTLYQNFPNPFPRADLNARSTRVWFDLAARSAVELAVYDLRGRLVKQLIPATAACGAVVLDAGEYGRTDSADACVQLTWDGRAANGDVVPRGIYLLRLRVAGREDVKKIVFLP